MAGKVEGIKEEDVHFLTLAAGYPQDAQVCFWMWKERRPQRRHKVCDLFYTESKVSFVNPVAKFARAAIGREWGSGCFFLFLFPFQREGQTNMALSERAVKLLAFSALVEI